MSHAKQNSRNPYSAKKPVASIKSTLLNQPKRAKDPLAVSSTYSSTQLNKQRTLDSAGYTTKGAKSTTKFGTEKRPDNFVNPKKVVPSPGQYESPNKWLSQSKMTFKAKHYKPRNENPGPNRYNTVQQIYYQRLTGGKIPKEDRKSPFLVREDYSRPGPGAHTPQKPRHTYSYSLRGKRTPSGDRSMPGPGAYCHTIDDMASRSLSSSFSGSLSKSQRDTGSFFCMKPYGLNATTLAHKVAAKRAASQSSSR